MRSLVFALALVVGLVVGGGIFALRGDAGAQKSGGPILVMEVASWTEGKSDPTTWQWQALDDGSLHIGFYAPGKPACANVTLPEGVTATWSGPDQANTTVAGPADPIEMCEAVFSRVNG
jgi:hypothetical protein